MAAVHFEAVEHFAAQGQDGLGVAVAGEFGGAAGGIAFHKEKLVFADVFAFAVGELAGQHGNAAAFAFFDFFHRTHALLGLFDGELGNFLAGFEVLVEPQFDGVAGEGGHEFERVAVGEFVFGLALELRIEHAHGKHEGDAVEYVVALDFHAARQKVVVGDEVGYGVEQGLFEPGFVGAAGGGGDEVDVALGGDAAFFQPGEGAGYAFAVGKITMMAT